MQLNNCIFQPQRLGPLADTDSVKLLHEVWSRISENDQQIICDNLTRIQFFDFRNDPEYQNHYKDGGYTISKDSHCEVRIDVSWDKNTIRIAIAHELGHVFYNHPNTRKDEVLAESETKAKAMEWGFVNG